jgi:hypothetical protein
MKKFVLACIPLAAALAGCGTTNSYLANRNTTVEIYHIFDIRTAASTAAVGKAVADGLGRNTNSINSNTPLQLGVVTPDVPGRFKIVDMTSKLAGTGMGNMLQLAAMQNGGLSAKAAICEDAAWTGRAERNIANSNNLVLYACLYKYSKGYQLDTYAVFQKSEGGLTQVSRDIASKLVGTPEEWVNKTIWDMVRSVETAAGTKVTHVEGQPELGAEPAIAQMTSR